MSEHVDAQFVDEPSTSLAIPQGNEPIRALVTPEEARAQWADYQALKAAIASADDYQEFRDKKSGKIRRFPKKSFVKKIQTYFGVSVNIVATQHLPLGGSDFGFTVTARATAPNGRYVEATAACATTEERFNFGDSKKRALHDVLSTAETRATNRAVMNLIGGGEVTAEEADKEPPVTQEPPVTASVDDAKARMRAELDDLAGKLVGDEAENAMLEATDGRVHAIGDIKNFGEAKKIKAALLKAIADAQEEIPF